MPSIDYFYHLTMQALVVVNVVILIGMLLTNKQRSREHIRYRYNRVGFASGIVYAISVLLADKLTTDDELFEPLSFLQTISPTCAVFLQLVLFVALSYPIFLCYRDMEKRLSEDRSELKRLKAELSRSKNVNLALTREKRKLEAGYAYIAGDASVDPKTRDEFIAIVRGKKWLN